MLYLIYLFIIISVFFILRGLFLEPQIDKSKLYARLPTEAKEVEVAKLRFLLSPLFLPSQIILKKLRLDEPLRRRLSAAHIKLAPKEFFTIKLILTFVLLVLVYFTFGKIDLLKGGLSILFGFFLPDIWLNRLIAKRKAAITRVLPETIDLIGLCIEAGQDFTTAVKWVLEKTRSNPLLGELAVAMEEIKWGKPRAQALKDMAKRLNMPDVNSFVQYLVQAERMGTPVAEAFAIISEDTRLQRFNRGERLALQAPIKILFPLLFFILPVIGIIIMGPIFLQFLGQKTSILSGF